jgi:hypothetical protein
VYKKAYAQINDRIQKYTPPNKKQLQNRIVKSPFLFCLLLVAAFFLLTSQNAPNNGQVAYYKQTGVVRNGTKTAGDNTGQFISFTFAGCYDSNNQRHEVGNGFLNYTGLQNNVHTYYGKSYWGEKTSYFFSSDFNRINIQTPDGVIYVYEKTAGTPPNSVSATFACIKFG